MAPWTAPPVFQQKQWHAGPTLQKPWLKQNQTYYQATHAPFGGAGAWGPPRHFERKPPPALPANFQIDPDTRYTGTVNFYAKWKGYGFIEVATPGVVPNDRLFVHWRNLQSDDRYPFLVKGLEVEFSLLKFQEKFNWKNVTTLRANEVTLVGGTNIAMQDDVDAQTKTFVGGQHLRYTGTLKFFSPKHGFGYVVMDQGYDVDASVPQELRVETSEVNAGGNRPVSMQSLSVEFGIWKTLRGSYKVYNMTLPGGHPLTQDALENRISMGSQTYHGEVAIWNWRQGWGFIRADASTVLPPRVSAKLAQQQQAAQARGRKITAEKMFYFRRSDVQQGAQVKQGVQVTFQLYIDDKGAGATEVFAA
mmetsp:Transcript_90589/g.157237  ORF Transcript_90589/g.157237 Transcript_90589/m.157237 type:complete len:362 (+) Transcript_90589:112-1197(+)